MGSDAVGNTNILKLFFQSCRVHFDDSINKKKKKGISKTEINIVVYAAVFEENICLFSYPWCYEKRFELA